MDKKIAVIDLGTNTFHLLFAEWNRDHYDITHRERIAVKIGMGGINQGIISEQGVSRAIDALRKFKEAIHLWGISKIFAFGTSAFRNAKNGVEIVKVIKVETGIEVKIISGDEEASYIYYGVRKAVKIGQQIALIVDIGGGSVEFIIANEETVFWKSSVEIGAQRLLERYQQHDPILPEEIEKLNSYFDETLSPLLEALHQYQPSALIGSSGTFDTLSEINCLRNGILQTINAPETPLTVESFREIFAELIAKDRIERLLIPGMIEMRVDMIVVACCLIAYLLDNASIEQIRVSSYSLKEGVLASLED